jgi:hypothetical protein
MKTVSEQQYLKDCTDFFAPLDEIAEAIRNKEGLQGVTYIELIRLVNSNPIMNYRLQPYL